MKMPALFDLTGRVAVVHGAQAIRMQLGGSASLVDPFPGKPKRMHWRTYQKLYAKAMVRRRSIPGKYGRLVEQNCRPLRSLRGIQVVTGRVENAPLIGFVSHFGRVRGMLSHKRIVRSFVSPATPEVSAPPSRSVCASDLHSAGSCPCRLQVGATCSRSVRQIAHSQCGRARGDTIRVTRSGLLCRPRTPHGQSPPPQISPISSRVHDRQWCFRSWWIHGWARAGYWWWNDLCQFRIFDLGRDAWQRLARVFCGR